MKTNKYFILHSILFKVLLPTVCCNATNFYDVLDCLILVNDLNVKAIYLKMKKQKRNFDKIPRTQSLF